MTSDSAYKNTRKREAANGFRDTVIKIVGGATRGSEFPILGPEFTIGRSSDADAQIQDSQISRVHCRLTWEDGKWYIEDAQSTNGTWMVGRKVVEKVHLPLKAPVRIGNTVFELYDLFSIDDSRSPKNPAIVCRLDPDSLAEVTEGVMAPVTGRGATKEECRRLSAVYKFQNLISAVFSEEELYQKILSAVANIIPVDAAYLLMFNIDTGDFLPVTGHGPRGASDKLDARGVNRELIAFVKDNREAVLSTTSYNEAQRIGVQGIPALITSVMCAPMFSKQQIIGMLYLSLLSPSERYNENDLRVLTAIGHIAGMAIENARLIDHNLKTERAMATAAAAAGIYRYVKTITAGIDGGANLFNMGEQNQDTALTREAVAIIRKNHRRLEELEQDLVYLSGEQEPAFSACDLNLIVNEVADACVARLTQDDINIKIEREVRKSPLLAEVDAKSVRRALFNLVYSAQLAIMENIEALDDMPGEIVIGGRYNSSRDSVLITVSDNGRHAGDNDEMGPSFEGSSGNKTGLEGGLALAVAKRVATDHDGSISRKTGKGKYNTVVFSVPVTHSELSTATCSIKRLRRH